MLFLPTNFWKILDLKRYLHAHIISRSLWWSTYRTNYYLDLNLERNHYFSYFFVISLIRYFAHFHFRTKLRTDFSSEQPKGKTKSLHHKDTKIRLTNNNSNLHKSKNNNSNNTNLERNLPRSLPNNISQSPKGHAKSSRRKSCQNWSCQSWSSKDPPGTEHPSLTHQRPLQLTNQKNLLQLTNQQKHHLSQNINRHQLYLPLHLQLST